MIERFRAVHKIPSMTLVERWLSTGVSGEFERAMIGDRCWPGQSRTIIGVSVGRWGEARGLQIVGRLKCRSPLRAALSKPHRTLLPNRIAGFSGKIPGQRSSDLALGGSDVPQLLGRFRAFRHVSRRRMIIE